MKTRVPCCFLNRVELCILLLDASACRWVGIGGGMDSARCAVADCLRDVQLGNHLRARLHYPFGGGVDRARSIIDITRL